MQHPHQTCKIIIGAPYMCSFSTDISTPPELHLPKAHFPRHTGWCFVGKEINVCTWSGTQRVGDRQRSLVGFVV